MSAVIDDLVARNAVLEFRGDMSVAERNRLAINDVADGMRLWPLAWSLGWLDIRLRYRGSILGPFWLTLSSAVLITSIGLLYSVLFNTDVRVYLPYLALSQILWSFLSTIVSDGCTCFTQAEGMIRAVRMPLFLHAMRTLVRNVLVLAHNVVVIVAVDVYFEIWPGWHALLALPGFAVWAIDSLALCLFLGAVCARFRDIAPITASIMQIAFFMTPVIWQAEQLRSGAAYLVYNPFFVLLQIVREPLQGHLPTMAEWISAIICSLLLCGLSWFFFVRARGRVAFWM